MALVIFGQWYQPLSLQLCFHSWEFSASKWTGLGDTRCFLLTTTDSRKIKLSSIAVAEKKHYYIWHSAPTKRVKGLVFRGCGSSSLLFIAPAVAWSPQINLQHSSNMYPWDPCTLGLGTAHSSSPQPCPQISGDTQQQQQQQPQQQPWAMSWDSRAFISQITKHPRATLLFPPVLPHSFLRMCDGWSYSHRDG